MAIDPVTWAQVARAGSTVELVTEATLPAYYACFAQGWETSAPDVAVWCADHVRALATGRFHFYLARVGGEPAGTAGFIVKARCAYLVGGNVLPQFRGRGVYRALLDQRLSAVAARGIHLAVTQAREATSAPILEALGFESLYRSHVYRWGP
jgi:GNAT superfamily N-acetyltransferase